MKNFVYDEKETLLVFKPIKNEKLEMKKQKADVLVYLSFILIPLCILQIVYNQWDIVIFFLALIAILYIAVGVAHFQYAKYSKQPKVTINPAGIRLDEGKKSYFLGWEEYSCLEIVPQIELYGDKENYTCVCFSSEKIDSEGVREKVYQISEGKLKRKEAFNNNFIYVILPNEDVETFTGLCNVYIEKLKNTEPKEEVKLTQTEENNATLENQEAKEESVSKEPDEDDGKERKVVYNKEKVSKSEIVTNICRIVGELIFAIIGGIAGLWRVVIGMIVLLIIPTAIILVKQCIAYSKNK